MTDPQVILDALNDIAQIIVLTLDSQGNILNLNPYALDLFGYRLDEIKGKDWFSTFLPKDDQEKIRHIFFQAINDIQTKGNINSVVTKDGRIIAIEWYDKTLKDVHGRTIGLLAIGQDVTERKKTQQQLIHAEKMEAVGRMAAGVAHEVKNPLAIILQGINYFETRASAAESQYCQMLQMMKNSVKRADDIVRQLLDFSRAQEFQFVPQEINPLIENSLKLAMHNLKLHNIEVSSDLENNLPKILLDKDKLEQVFVNLLNNAVDAMPEGGRICVRSYLSQITEAQDKVGKRRSDYFHIGEKVLAVEISDTGKGIEEEAMNKIFDPFFTTKKRGEGTGLGLPVSKSIIDMHKGLIDVQSKKGEGAKFTIIFGLPEGG